MYFLKKILNFYVLSNIHVAISGFCLAKISLLKNNNTENITPLFVALSIIISYNFIQFYETKTGKMKWFNGKFNFCKLPFYIVTILAFMGLLWLLFLTAFNLQSLLVLIPFGVMTFFYAIPLFKIGNIEVSFRNFPFIKIFSIAFAWAGVTTIFPLVEATIEFNNNEYLEFIQRFLILIAITLPFDIRDVKYDSEELKTLPQVVGIKKSKIIGFFLVIIFCLLELLKTELYILSTFIIGAITILFLIFSTEKKSNYYASFWVEAIPIYWLIILLVTELANLNG